MSLLSKEKIEYLKKTFFYLKKYKKLSFLVILFAFLSSLFEGFGLTTIIPLFQGLVSADLPHAISLPYWDVIQKYLVPEKRDGFIIVSFSFILLMVVLKNIFNYLNIITVNKTSNFVKRDLQIDLFNRIVGSHLKFFNSMKAGHLIGSISVYAENVSSFIFAFLSFAIVITRVLIYVMLLLLISWKTTIAIFIIGILIVPFVRFILIRIKNIWSRISKNVSTLHFRMTEMFNNIYLMKIFGTEDHEKKRFAKASTDLAWNHYTGAKYSNILAPTSEILVIILMVVVSVYALVIVKLEVALYVPLIITYMYVFSRLYKQINDATRLLSTLFSYIEPFKAYEKVLKQATDAVIENGDITLKQLKKEIIFEQVNFGYSKNRLVLSRVNFSIPKGKFTALVGPTGVGKTTIANLIAGLYFADKGNILVDGHNMKELDLDNWREKIGYVSQDIMIFNDTVSNNIRYGTFNASDEDVKKAAQAANLHEYIIDLKDGYDTILGERGIKLSGGQRQRLSIARAIIRQPEILILDEATSSLDVKIEKAIQEELITNFKDRTIIAIAHRLSTVINADNIVVLHEGKVVEQGNHHELLEKNGFYDSLYNLQ